jgi:hypothetical protein
MKQVALVVSLVAAIMLTGCAGNKMTSFRKHGASMEDERRDWGLCGGDFHANGRLRTTPNGTVVECMRDKGYLTLNDYYVEQHISFVNVRQPEQGYVPTDTLQACRFLQLDKGLCSRGVFFLTKANLAASIKCMSSRGFEPTVPDQGSGFQIVDNVRTLSPNFCLSLTPRNQMGGVRFNGWRWE